MDIKRYMVIGTVVDTVTVYYVFWLCEVLNFFLTLFLSLSLPLLCPPVNSQSVWKEILQFPKNSLGLMENTCWRWGDCDLLK